MGQQGIMTDLEEQKLREKIADKIMAELICCTPSMDCHQYPAHDMCRHATLARDLVLDYE
jgi:hypothetical protein